MFSNFTFLKLFLNFLFSYFLGEKFFIVKENYISASERHGWVVKTRGENCYLLLYVGESEVERVVITQVVPGPLPAGGELALGTSQGRRDRDQEENQGDFVKPHLRLGQTVSS